ncbi:FAD-binding domain-containing protein [Lentinus tigrinus ALCF2SS1-7]|uniref:FAD-binding domain-containing protein n=1 Tax=Lentinus tigrinus ALCF2SS1-6 TaxID=1328759 RepID=A0A5C2RNS5_9APHY|nr:FAD-binding domain-containing protein [Lentinus tigrinus ALCF2SS1-6]RPD73206.1 FAD-binding domain-containing protein [Lentinus tigrinus ALCF2SS1-7]
MQSVSSAPFYILSYMRSTVFLIVLLVVPTCMGGPIAAVSEEQWKLLNSSVHGRLHAAVPFARPCFAQTADTVFGEADQEQCVAVQATYTDPGTRAGIMGSFMNTEWETCQATSQQCLLDFLDPRDTNAFNAPQICAQGSIPSYFVDVRDPADVQASFAFSRKTGVRIVVKNTGHDYAGRSSGANALALWMHNLQEISYTPAFIPAGCSKSSAVPGVTMGAGVSQGQLYDFAEAHNITLPGGAERSVAAVGGYLQGGGHSALANVFGLAVDRALEAKIVTPDGRYLTASACQNADLFFAIRGGGGGTFGVLMEATMRALPQMSFPAVFVGLNATEKIEKEWMEFIVAHSLQWAETGWGGYITPKTGMIFANPLLNMSQAEQEMASLKQFVTTTLGATFSLTLQPSFLTFFNNFLLTTGVPVGLPFLTTSRLIPADNFRSSKKQAELVDTVIEVLDDSPLPLIFVVGTYHFKDRGGTSVNPIWRKSLWHVTSSTFWNFNTTTTEKKALYSNFTSQMNLLREITPGSGTYFNEADVHEPDSTASFWGDNYDRLVEIKRKYDPDHLLDCWQCVDSKGPDSEHFSCYL